MQRLGITPAKVLVGDIGGTHSRLAIFNMVDDGVSILRRGTYSSKEHPGLHQVVGQFLSSKPERVDVACFGLPGPIHSELVFPMPNLPWEINRPAISRTIGTDNLELINDVEASACGIPDLKPTDLHCLQDGQPDPKGNKVVISIGTGLGVSALTPSGTVIATEAGHASFSPHEAIDFELYQRLAKRYGHVSWERAIAGSALPHIHALHTSSAESEWDGPTIFEHSKHDEACLLAVNTLRRLIGSAVGDIALTLFASGGIYLRGGVATNVLTPDSSEEFLTGFLSKGRMNPVLQGVPIFVVKEQDMALHGAARRAYDYYQSRLVVQ